MNIGDELLNMADIRGYSHVEEAEEIVDEDAEEEFEEEAEEDPTCDIEEGMKMYSDKLNKIELPVPPPGHDVNYEPIRVMAPPCNPKNNIILPHNTELFRSELLKTEDEIFTEADDSTDTLDGFISNVSFLEEHLIHQLIPSPEIVGFECNFGMKYYKTYYPKEVRVKSNRGRKPMYREPKIRKTQGDGTSMNSQCTFIIPIYDITPDTVLNWKLPVLKIKVFRDGRIQLPGVKKSIIYESIAAARRIATLMNRLLHPNETRLDKLCYLTHLTVLMCNFKYKINLKPYHVIDQHALLRIAEAENLPQIYPEAGFAFVKFSFSDSMFTIYFKTPKLTNPYKITRMNIWLRGKVNILGGETVESVQRIHEFLRRVIKKHWYDIIVVDNTKEQKMNVWDDNVKDDGKNRRAMWDAIFAANDAELKQYLT